MPAGAKPAAANGANAATSSQRDLECRQLYGPPEKGPNLEMDRGLVNRETAYFRQYTYYRYGFGDYVMAGYERMYTLRNSDLPANTDYNVNRKTAYPNLYQYFTT